MENQHPYQRLQIQLAELIANTPPGQRLPSEPQLAKELGVSRATLREAMRSFEGQGLIRRRQGKGTFVVQHPRVIESGLEVLESLETLAQRIGLEVHMGECTIAQVGADDTVAAGLRVAPGTTVVRVERVILADNRPVAFLVDILPQNILTPEELNEGFTGSVLDFLLHRGTPQLADSFTEIRAVAASSDIARRLEIQRGDVLLMFQAQLFDAGGNVVDFSHSYFLPGYFRFHVVRRVGTPVRTLEFERQGGGAK
ncbi:MAG: GntR family transcriptional regulator [Thermanaerothrix sp.]|uniref:GntR family transcriptional regulator n=1 Tax=Thermanaerothrix sp. TaxID=2972675 RepID=UPI003C7C3111